MCVHVHLCTSACACVCLCICDFVQINNEVKMARKELKKAQSIMQLDELKCRKRVLRR